MNDESSKLRERMARLSDEELIRIVTVDAQEYRLEALNFAKAELKARDIDFEAPQVVGSGTEKNSDDTEEELPAPGKPGPICPACGGGRTRSAALVAEKELTIIFTDNKEERFVRVEACGQCGQIVLTVDLETAVE